LKHLGLLAGPLRDVLHRQHMSNSPSSIARPGAPPPGAEPPSPGRPDRPPTTRAGHNYSSRLRTLAPSGLAPRPGSLVNGRPPPERVLAACHRLLLQSPRRLLRRPPPSARGLLRQPPESPVPHPQRAPPTGYRSPRPQHLSTRGQVYQSNLATTTTLRG
jgi:hypothetical protein